jgi:hypothetical protein
MVGYWRGRGWGIFSDIWNNAKSTLFEQKTSINNSSKSGNTPDVRIPAEIVLTRGGGFTPADNDPRLQFNMIDYVNPFETTFE